MSILIIKEFIYGGLQESYNLILSKCVRRE